MNRVRQGDINALVFGVSVNRLGKGYMCTGIRS